MTQNKRLPIQIDSCQNCFFCDRAKHASCLYGQIMLNGHLIPLHDITIIPTGCPLDDATEVDNTPAPVRMVLDENGCTIVIDD